VARENRSASATSKDVARRVGVSQSAVSLVFGGKADGRVGAETKDAILRAARELDYHPSSAARTLRSGRSRLIALAVPDVGNPYFASVLEGVERAARQRNYAVMLTSVRSDRDWQQVVDTLAARSVDGFLLFSLVPQDRPVRAALRGRAVVVDAYDSDFPSLRLGVEAGMRVALTHLFHLGHTKIGHLAAAVDVESFRFRRRTFLSVMQDQGLSVLPSYLAYTRFSLSEARLAARRLLACPDPPTAVVCDSDMLAVGVYKAARDLHRAIPADLSVVSFDDSIIARILDPELTTLAISSALVGEQAVLLLLKTLESSQAPRPSIVPLDLLVRASTDVVSWKD